MRSAHDAFIAVSGRAFEAAYPSYATRSEFDTDLLVPRLDDGIRLAHLLHDAGYGCITPVFWGWDRSRRRYSSIAEPWVTISWGSRCWSAGTTATKVPSLLGHGWFLGEVGCCVCLRRRTCS